MSSIPEIPIDLKDIYGKGTNVNYLPFFLRFMLFCDQCHDFCEKDERNNWKNNIRKVFDRLSESYKEDIEWLFDFNFVNDIEKKNILENFKIDFEIAKDTEKMVEKIDSLLSISEISGQIPFNSVNLHDIDEKINPCSSSASLVLSVIKVLSEQSVSLSKFYIAVDADKSKMNLGSLLLFFCDRVSSYSNTEINLVNTIATKYDAASGSGTFSYLNKIQENLYKITKRNGGQIQNIDETNQNIIINLKFNDISLIKFAYVNEDKVEEDEKAKKILTIFDEIFKNPSDINYVIGLINSIDDKIISIKELDNLKAILKDIILIPNAIPIFPGASIYTSWSGVSKGGQELFNIKLQSLGYTGPSLSKNKALFLLLFSILSLDPSLPGEFASKLRSLTITKKVVSLQISNFFAKTYIAGMDKMSEDQASVNSITKMPFTENLPLKKLVNFNTLGDFGQILVYYIFITKKFEPQFIDFFITFDQICSRIASLFLKYTVFENLNKDVFISPMTVFVKKELLGNLTSATGALLSLMNTATVPTGSNGTSRTTVSFGKSRYYNQKLIKLSKKYRIKLDKYISQNIKNLLKLQNHAKKLGINITKKNSKGKRIYKTINELVKNIKKYSKKTNSSKKNNTLKNLTKDEKQKLLRSKSKKHGIKITKLNNKGIRVYKSNTQLINELKKN